MKNSKEYLKLISDLEYIVAKHCSTDTLNNGKDYRYPVRFTDKNGKEIKYDVNYGLPLASGQVPTLKYKFGVHTLEIGKALEEIIEYITDNYDDTSFIPYN